MSRAHDWAKRDKDAEQTRPRCQLKDFKGDVAQIERSGATPLIKVFEGTYSLEHAAELARWILETTGHAL